MKILRRIKDAIAVLRGKKFASKFPPIGSKRRRNKNQGEINFRMIEGGEA